MTDYIKEHQKFFAGFAAKCELAITLQTSFLTHNKSSAQIESMASEAIKGMHRFRPRLNRLLSGNGWKRSPEHLPIIVAALEGTGNSYDRNRSLHYHLAVGNFDPARVESAAFSEQLTRHWLESGIGTTDVHIQRMTAAGAYCWGMYIGKEAWQGNLACIDLENTQIPKHLLGD